VSLLEIARVHHDVLLEVLHNTQPTVEDVTAVAAAASGLFLEVLATYCTNQRAFLRRP
jgi:hypothetical protein